MARIKNLQTGQTIYLMPYHSFGRRKGMVDTVIGAPEVSNNHATITWDNNQWVIRDQSRNGTWLDDHQLEKGTFIALEPGQKISFASPDGHGLAVIDLAAPVNQLINLTNDQKTIALDSYNLIPDDEVPEIVIYKNTDESLWRYHQLSKPLTPSHKSPLANHGQDFFIGGQAWRLFLPKFEEPTAGISQEHRHDLADYQFKFYVSSDEESVQLCVCHHQQQLVLGTKTHYELLLYLARKRLQDAADGVDQREQGWVRTDVLYKELGTEELLINVHVYRIRASIAKFTQHLTGQDTILERRRGAIRTGINAKNIFIEGGARVSQIIGAPPVFLGRSNNC